MPRFRDATWIQALKIEAYAHSKRAGTDTITIGGDVDQALLIPLSDFPAAWTSAKLADLLQQPKAKIRRLKVVDGAFKLTFRMGVEKAPAINGYILVLLPPDAGTTPALSAYIARLRAGAPVAFLELVRQSAAFLQTWGFDRSAGYTIAGRTSLHYCDRPFPSYQLPAIDCDVDAGDVRLPRSVENALESDPPEASEAARIASLLFKKPLAVGPSTRLMNASASYSVGARIRDASTGKLKVQCGSVRDLWATIAKASPRMGGVRIVSAFNSHPDIGDLIPYSHAAAEFWVKAERRWILADPWFGFMVRHKGVLLSAKQVGALGARCAEATFAPLRLRLAHRRYDGLDTRSTRQAFREVWSNPVAPAPSYTEYYRVLDVAGAERA